VFIFTGIYKSDYLLFSFACLGLNPEAQLRKSSGEIFINPSMPDSEHRTVLCAFQCIANVKALLSGQKVKVKVKQSLYRPGVAQRVSGS